MSYCPEKCFNPSSDHGTALVFSVKQAEGFVSEILQQGSATGEVHTGPGTEISKPATEKPKPATENPVGGVGAPKPAAAGGQGRARAADGRPAWTGRRRDATDRLNLAEGFDF